MFTLRSGAHRWASWNLSVAKMMLSLHTVIWKETGILQNFAVRILIETKDLC